MPTFLCLAHWVRWMCLSYFAARQRRIALTTYVSSTCNKSIEINTYFEILLKDRLSEWLHVVWDKWQALPLLDGDLAEWCVTEGNPRQWWQNPAPDPALLLYPSLLTCHSITMYRNCSVCAGSFVLSEALRSFCNCWGLDCDLGIRCEQIQMLCPVLSRRLSILDLQGPRTAQVYWFSGADKAEYGQRSISLLCNSVARTADLMFRGRRG